MHHAGVNSNRKKVMSRPFGVSLLVGGVDKESGPSLWCTDPSGTSIKYSAASIGSAHEGAEVALNESYRKDMSLEGNQMPLTTTVSLNLQMHNP